MYALNKTKYLLASELSCLVALLERTEGRDAVLLLTLLKTGARAQELLDVAITDLNKEDKTIFIRGSKGSKDREIPLSPKLFKRIVAIAPENGLLFPISYKRLFQIWQMYKPVNKKLHSLRHTFAIELYKKTKDLRLVQTALGHKSINNTMIYSDYLYSQEELRKIL